MKICKKCGRYLDESRFGKNSTNKDGLQYFCKECFSEYNKKRYASNKEKFRADIKKYKEDNPDKVLATRLKIAKENPTGKNCYRAVDAALKAGVLVRQDYCSGCGCSNKEHRIEAHHARYDDPLNVIWLCTPCHRRMDAERRKREGLKPYGASK